jgi:hypothetical protein
VKRQLQGLLRRLTQEQLGALLGVGRRSVGGWLKRGVPKARREAVAAIWARYRKRPAKRAEKRPKGAKRVEPPKKIKPQLEQPGTPKEATELFQRALTNARSARALAQALGVTARTIERWAKRGLPKAAWAKLRAFLAGLAPEKVAPKRPSDYVEFARMLESVDMAGLMPSMTENDSEGWAGGQRIEQYAWRFSLERLFTRVEWDVLERRIERLKAKRGLPYWQIILVYSSYGLAKRQGYGGQIVQFVEGQLQGAEALFGARLPTPRAESRESALDALALMGQELLRENRIVLVHEAIVLQYRYKDVEND